MVDRTIGCVA